MIIVDKSPGQHHEEGNTEDATVCLAVTNDEMFRSYNQDGQRAAVRLLLDSLMLEHKYLFIWIYTEKPLRDIVNSIFCHFPPTTICQATAERCVRWPLPPRKASLGKASCDARGQPVSVETILDFKSVGLRFEATFGGQWIFSLNDYWWESPMLT